MEPNANAQPDEKAGPVWQPLTFGGVAAFARASWGRLWLVQIIFAIAAAASVMYFVKSTWFESVREAVKALPDKGEIRAGELYWATNSPMVLSEGHFLTILVDLDHSGQSGQVADLQLELGRTDLKLSSLAGETRVPYDPAWIIPVNRLELDPWWGAWQPALVTGVGLMTFVGLFASWIALATVYAIPARILAFFADREATYLSCWRLAAAALLPGALLMTVAVFLHATRHLPLLGLGIILGIHLVVGWLYVFWTPFLLPKRTAKFSTASNPFGEAGPSTPSTPPALSPPAKPVNPFQDGSKPG